MRWIDDTMGRFDVARVARDFSTVVHPTMY
jgi:hypothetical protein